MAAKRLTDHVDFSWDKGAAHLIRVAQSNLSDVKDMERKQGLLAAEGVPVVTSEDKMN